MYYAIMCFEEMRNPMKSDVTCTRAKISTQYLPNTCHSNYSFSNLPPARNPYGIFAVNQHRKRQLGGLRIGAEKTHENSYNVHRGRDLNPVSPS
jgi:hypothetical protein